MNGSIASSHCVAEQLELERKSAARRDTLLLCAFLCLYATAGLLLLTKLSLWLDEIIDLHLIRDFSLHEQIIRIPMNAGGVPLSYFVRDAFCSVLGYSTFAGRLPSLLFSILAAIGVFALARQMKLRYPALAAVLFCSMPIQFRYALESRPYSAMLAITIWATFVFRKQLAGPTISMAVVYGLLAVTGLYTQPYSIFIFAAHFLWVCTARRIPNRHTLLALVGIPLVVASFAFLPWEIWITSVWDHTASARQPYTLGIRTLLLLFHELTGAGYLGTAVIALLSTFGLIRAIRSSSERLFWLLCILVPTALALLTDQLFGYFFAIRQLLPITFPMLLLAAAGIETIWSRSRRRAILIFGFVLVTFLVGTVKFYRRPRENWMAAATILDQQGSAGSCISYSPPSSAELFRFFVRGLDRFSCPADLSRQYAIALGVSPYQGHDTERRLEALENLGFQLEMVWNQNGPKVCLLVRKH